MVFMKMKTILTVFSDNNSIIISPVILGLVLFLGGSRYSSSWVWGPRTNCLAIISSFLSQETGTTSTQFSSGNFYNREHAEIKEHILGTVHEFWVTSEAIQTTHRKHWLRGVCAFRIKFTIQIQTFFSFFLAFSFTHFFNLQRVIIFYSSFFNFFLSQSVNS